MSLVDRAQKLWRQSPAIRQLPEALAKYGIMVDPEPFTQLAEYVEEREEHMWRELEKCVIRKCGDCRLTTHVVRGAEVYSLECAEENGTRTAKLLTDVAKTLYETLPQTQRLWLKENGESLLIGFELADVGVANGLAHLGTSDGFNVLLYALVKYATGKELKRVYVRQFNLTKKGVRLVYRLDAEATLAVSKKTLYDTARRNLPLPSQVTEAFKNPAAWLGLLLGDGVIWPKAVGISTDVPELVRRLIPYTAGVNKRAVVLRRFVADIAVRHAQPIAPLLDALAEAFREAMPTEPKWVRLRRLAARRIDAKTAVELFKNGLHDLLGEARRKEEDFVVFRRVENDKIVYTYLVKIGEKWHAAQARFRYKKGRWVAQIHTKDAETLQKIKTKLGLTNKIYGREDGRYAMELYKKAMI